MYEIIYSPTVQEKLAMLKTRLIELCGEKVGIKRLAEAIDGFELRLAFSNTGCMMWIQNLKIILSFIRIKIIFCII